MLIIKEINVPATKKSVVEKVVCDLCGSEAEPSRLYAEPWVNG
jgi:hypothetical protein